MHKNTLYSTGAPYQGKKGEDAGMLLDVLFSARNYAKPGLELKTTDERSRSRQGKAGMQRLADCGLSAGSNKTIDLEGTDVCSDKERWWVVRAHAAAYS
jgi:hypothetical protein